MGLLLLSLVGMQLSCQPQGGCKDLIMKGRERKSVIRLLVNSVNFVKFVNLVTNEMSREFEVALLDVQRRVTARRASSVLSRRRPLMARAILSVESARSFKGGPLLRGLSPLSL